ncbi:uncharacterized protein ASPGLDRAFT_41894 [Aspergillus glaucus CBS 516.65]|uniref:Reverse transcriptase domain-containing protein n=1 Tax=Aspergillus glaucus CBS 516.65 TaxID=1160497 RepID=A0A1L9VWQ3_ASPGL|nr:hypothetical protein ASPGLDRAFT_41894 [Aspergillus glaucus CBS 516.65]OJJ88334.1 hypothetical protein ASPGLDRAFT_41894 [Aspergillus glaucus CBS 516.65]
MMTWDVKGAFDAVLSGRLIQHLRDQGWPSTVLHWVASFTQGRTATIRLDGSGHQSVTDILCTKAGSNTYAKWLGKSHFYTDICRRH